MSYADDFTTNLDAAAAFEESQSLPPDDRPTLGDVVDEDGFYPGRFRDASDWNVSLGMSS